jgi:hypothetical protein
MLEYIFIFGCKVKKFIKYIAFILRKLDVSPITPGGLSKELIVIFWGLNAMLFIADCLIIDCNYVHYDGVACTVVKQTSSTDFYSEQTEIIKDRSFILISSYNFILPEFDVSSVTRDRSPPEKI